MSKIAQNEDVTVCNPNFHCASTFVAFTLPTGRSGQLNTAFCLRCWRWAWVCTALLMFSGLAQAQLFLNVNKSFNPISVGVGRTSSLVITFANTNPTTSATALSGTDTLPTGAAYVSAGSATCGIVPVVGSLFTGGGTLTWSGGTVPPNSVCTITAIVTPLVVGASVNTIPINNVSAMIGTNTVAAFTATQATLSGTGTFAPLTGSKTVSNAVIHGGGTRSYTVNLTNPNAIPLTGLAFTDVLDTDLQVAVPGGVSSNSCGGAVTDSGGGALGDGDLGIRLTGGTLAASGSCSVTFVIRTANTTTPQTQNGQNNTIAIGSVTTAQGISNAAELTVGIRIERGVAVAKAFAPATIITGGTSLLTISISNFNLASIANAGLTDTFPVNVTGVTLGSVTAATCGAPTVSVTGPRVVVSNATLAGAPNPDANGASVCNISAVVTSAVAGVYPNTIPAGSFTGGFTYGAANQNLTVNNPPASIGGAKNFVPGNIPQDGTSLLTLTLTNSGATAASNTAFTDNLLTMGGSITVALTPLPTNSCGGTLTATPGGTSFSLVGGTIPAASNCVITVPVVAASNAATGGRTNSIPAGSVSTSLGTNSAVINGVLTINADINAAKVFAPNSVPQTGSSVLTITLSNAAGGPNAAITSFTDSLATAGAGITIRAAPAPTNTCGGTLSAVAGSTTISLTGGVITAGGNCQLTIPVDIAANAVAGARTNTINAGALVTDQGNNPNNATANITIVNALTISKAYNPATVGPSQVSRLTVTIAHAAGAVAFSGMAVTDTLPAGHTVANPANVFNICGGTVTANPGSATFALAGGGLPEGASTCTFAVNIQSPAGTGTVANTIPIGSVTTTQGVTNAAAATANLTRSAGLPVTLNKNFTPPNITGGASSVLLVSISNPNAFPLTNVALSDRMPAGMTVFGIPNASTTCAGGAVVAVAGSNTFSLNSATVPASGACTFQANVTSVVGGNSINTIPVGTLTSAQSVTNDNSPSATLQVLFNLNVGKAFLPVVTQAGLTSTLIVTVYNSNTATIAGFVTASVVDILPAGPPGLEIANATSSTTCGGTVVDSNGGALGAGDLGFRLNGGSFGASSQCDITVQVRTVPAGSTGSFVNTIPASTVRTNVGATNPTPAVATVTFVANPTLLKAFNPVSVIPGALSTLTFTLGNPNAAALFPGGLSNASYTDTLPAGLSIFAPGPATGTCAGAGSNNFSAGQTTLAFSGLTIAPASNCTVAVVVTAATTGVRVNTVTGLVSTQTPSPSTPVSTATLTALTAPSISKFFSPSSIQSSGTGTAVLTIVVTNPNATPVLLATPGLQDVFPTSPGAMVVGAVPAATSCAGAAIVDSGGGGLAVNDVGIRLNGGTVPANGSCTLTVTVLVPLPGTYFNSSNVVTSTNAGISALGATANFTVTPVANLTVTKTNGLTTLAAGSTVGYTLTFTNNGPADATGANVRDIPPPAGLDCTLGLTCNATGGASCPSLNIPIFITTGLNLPTFPSGGQVTFNLVCLVTATGF